MKKNNIFVKNLILFCIFIIITIIPFFWAKGADFGGADGKAEEIIAEVNAEYLPWFESIIELPSSETESLLFALQAAFGTGVICYYIGYKKSKKDSAAKAVVSNAAN